MRRNSGWLYIVMAALLLSGSSDKLAAQSLDIKRPTPIVQGQNRGTLDNMVGAQYWYFKYHPGDCKVTLHYTSMALFGNPQTTTVNVVLHGPKGEIFLQRAITSNGREAQVDMPAKFTTSGTMTIELKTAGMALVRAGGDYSISVTGTGVDLAGGAASAAAAPPGIVGTYSVMVCAPDFDCQSGLAIRFAANGTVQVTDGHSGTWKLFDPEQGIYTVNVGRDRWTLKLVPGRGLFATNDLSVVVFQSIRPR
jgi:hypothetical protein